MQCGISSNNQLIIRMQSISCAALSTFLSELHYRPWHRCVAIAPYMTAGYMQLSVPCIILITLACCCVGLGTEFDP
jgi:hypothetical protein